MQEERSRGGSDNLYNTDLSIYAHAAKYLTPGTYKSLFDAVDNSFDDGSVTRYNSGSYNLTGGSFTLAVSGNVVTITLNNLTAEGEDGDVKTLAGMFTCNLSAPATRASFAPPVASAGRIVRKK